MDLTTIPPRGIVVGVANNPGYAASNERLLKRLARVEGQVRGLTRMVEQERYCIDILTQIQAAEAALHGVALELLDDHVRNCMDGTPAERTEKTDELMGAVGRLIRG